MEQTLRFRLYECAGGHQIETAETVVSITAKQKRKEFINRATVRGSETRWRDTEDYRT